MDTASLAAAYVASTQAQTGQALQAKLLKMSADQQAGVVALLEAGAQGLQSAPAAPPPGLGGTVDVSA